MKEFFDIIKEFVSLPICLIFVVFLQVLKKLLEAKNIKPKSTSFWFYITLAMGFPLALLSNAVHNFEGWNIARYIIEGFGYAGGCTIIYAAIRQLNIESIKNLFSKNEEDVSGGV